MADLPELSFEGGRHIVNLIAEKANEYAGIPIPVDGEELIIHPSYRFADICKTLGRLKEKNGPSEDDTNDTVRVINAWWSSRRGWEYILYERNKKIHFTINQRVRHANLQLRTLGVSIAWTLEAETKAVMKLGHLLSHRPHAMHQYALTGSFLEKSHRSEVTYMFRRLRPTLALSSRTGAVRLLCALCLHPIGYYANTWAGAMCPTDEVIAHLMLMRGDEHDFWKQANQHPAYRPEAGI